MSKRLPKFEALVVNAIRRLQASQGSTASEIANYLHHKYDVYGPEIRRQIQLTIRRGINYGILEKSKRGYTTCDRTIPELVESSDVSDCYNCRRSARRGQGPKRGHRNAGKSLSRKRGAKRRSVVSKKSRTGRRATRTPRKQMSSSDNAKPKKSTSQDEIPSYGRQPSNHSNPGRSNSKSPTRSSDEKRET